MEKRKTVKHYLDFIKSSQRFYRGFIQRLSSQFGDIPELLEVAHRCNLESKCVQMLRVYVGWLILHSFVGRRADQWITSSEAIGLAVLPPDTRPIRRSVTVP